MKRFPSGGGTERKRTGDGCAVYRTLASTAPELQVLSPGSGTAVDARRPTFRWTEVPGTPYYDVRISASIREPDQFDPYALRQRVTRLLVERFGLEIHVNGHCQPPCGRWDKRRDDRPL